MQVLPRAASAAYTQALPRIDRRHPAVSTRIDTERAEESAADGDKIRYEVPFGESGKEHMRSPSPARSFHHLYRFEQIHAARHRALAQRYGLAVESQRVRIKTGLTEKGELIALAGATETSFDRAELPSNVLPSRAATGGELPPDAVDGELLLRELAYVSDLARYIATGGAPVFGMSKRSLPSVRFAGSVGSARRMLNNRDKIYSDQRSQPDLMRFLRNISGRSLSYLVAAYEPLEKAVGKLREELDAFAGKASSLTGMSVSGGPPVAEVRIRGPEVEPGTHTLMVNEIAEAHAVDGTRENAVYATFDKLLDEDDAPVIAANTADFVFDNGTDAITVTVGRDDTFATIAAKINYGEDLNNNGFLDEFDGYEDADADDVIDGGTAEHDVVATLVGNRLRLSTSAAVTITDDDEILRRLGLVEDDEGTLAFTETGAYYPRSLATLATMYDDAGEAPLPLNSVTFSLNGVDVVATEADNVFTLRDRINWGEDFNRNGVLDTDDVDYTVPGFAREDEDLDGELDGGTAAHGVIADIVGGNLRLRQADPGAGEIQLRDTSGLMEALGVLVENGKGIHEYVRVAQPASDASITLDGEDRRDADNLVDDAIDGLEIELLQAGEESVQITVAGDVAQLKDELEELISSYNATLAAFNEALSPYLEGALKNDPKATRSYTLLRNAVADPVERQPERYDRAGDIGLKRTIDGRIVLQALQLQSARLRRPYDSEAPGLARAQFPASVYNILDELGLRAPEHNTLSLDEKKLDEAVSRDVSALRDFFRTEEIGLLDRLAEAGDRVGHPLRGELAFGRYRLGVLRDAIATRQIVDAQRQIREAAYRQSLLASATAATELIGSTMSLTA